MEKEQTTPINFTYQQLEILLNKLVSPNPNNQEIKECNEQLKKYIKNILSVEGLIAHIKSNPNPQIRQLACILLYRKFEKHFPKLDEQIQENVKNLMFELYLSETNFLVLKAISNIIFKITKIYLIYDKTQKANELLDFILKDPQAYKQEEADRFAANLNILSELIESNFVYLPERIGQIKNIIQISLKMGTNKIKEISAKCLGSFLLTIETEDLKFVEDIIPNLLAEMQHFNPETIMHVYENFCDFSHKAMIIFQNNFDKIVRVSLDFLNSEELDNITISVISEFLLLICEGKNKKVFKANNCELLKLAIERAFKLAAVEPGVEESVEESAPKRETGERMIEGFSQLFPSKFVFEICMNFVKQMLNSPNGFLRKQAIMLIGHITEGCSEKIKENLADFINLVEEKFKNDADNRVKIACLMVIDRLSEFCYPQIVEFYDRIIPISITGLFSGEAELVENSLVAFRCYSENPEVEVAPYVPQILPRLIELLDSKVVNIQRDALSCLSVIVDNTKDELKNTLIPILETCRKIILEKKDDSEIEVRAYALRCVAHIAYSIKLEKFSPYLTFFSEIAVNAINSSFFELQDAGFVYLKYIAELLGESFGSELPNVMPIALKLLKDDSGIVNAKANELANEEEDLGSDNEDDEEDMQEVRVNEAFVAAKCSIINAISSFAKSAPSHFMEYIPLIITNFDEIIDYVDENVNIELIIAYQSLMVSIDKAEKASNKNSGNSLNLAKQLWMKDILPKFEKIFSESNLKIEIVNVLESIYGIIDYFGREMFLENNSLERIFTMVKTLLEFKATCQVKNEEEDLEEDEIDHDAEILDHVSDIFMITAEKLQNDFHPILTTLMPILKKYLSTKRSLGDRAIVFGCLADTLKYCKITIKFYFEFLLNIITENAKANLKTKDDELFRNMAFLLGVMFENDPVFCKDFFNASLNQLHFIFENAGKMGKENVIAALCRIAYSLQLAYGDEILSKIIETVFANVPLVNDYQENMTVFKFADYLSNIADIQFFNKCALKVFDVVKYLVLNKLKCQLKDEEIKQIKAMLEKLNNNGDLKSIFDGFLAVLSEEERGNFMNGLQNV